MGLITSTLNDRCNRYNDIYSRQQQFITDAEWMLKEYKERFGVKVEENMTLEQAQNMLKNLKETEQTLENLTQQTELDRKIMVLKLEIELNLLRQSFGQIGVEESKSEE